jgi:Flp pilus assembly protein protease CpaA
MSKVYELDSRRACMCVICNSDIKVMRLSNKQSINQATIVNQLISQSIDEWMSG